MNLKVIISAEEEKLEDLPKILKSYQYPENTLGLIPWSIGVIHCDKECTHTFVRPHKCIQGTKLQDGTWAAYVHI